MLFLSISSNGISLSGSPFSTVLFPRTSSLWDPFPGLSLPGFFPLGVVIFFGNSLSKDCFPELDLEFFFSVEICLSKLGPTKING